MKLKAKKGFALATTLILLGVVLIGVSGLLSVAKIEARISRSQKESVQAYYVAEAGVQNAIWQIKNNNDYFEDLDDGTLDETFTSSNQIMNLRDISIHAQSTEPGYAEIAATGLVNEDRYPAQRLVKIKIFRGAKVSAIENAALYSAFGLSLFGTQNFVINNGHSYGRNSQVHRFSSGAISGKIQSRRDYLNFRSQITHQGIEAANYPPQAINIPMPGIDFDQLKQAAKTNNTYYTEAQWCNLLGSGETVNLPGPITFIDSFDVYVGPLLSCVYNHGRVLHLIVHGLLVVNGGFHFFSPSVQSSWDLDFQIYDDRNGPSGIIVRRDFSIVGQAEPLLIEGIVYAAGEIRLIDTENLTVTGGIVTNDFIDIASDNLIINNDQEKIAEMIGYSENPSTLEINHWEEEY